GSRPCGLFCWLTRLGHNPKFGEYQTYQFDKSYLTKTRSEDDSSSNLDELNAVNLSYRIGFRRFGCPVRSGLRCTVSEGVQLTNASIGEIGYGVKCPNALSRPTMFSIGRKLVDLNLGDLCGTGNEDSWVRYSVYTITFN
ncbi:hypothetical protein D915_010934, partial [Fasciola hepatica]